MNRPPCSPAPLLPCLKRVPMVTKNKFPIFWRRVLVPLDTPCTVCPSSSPNTGRRPIRGLRIEGELLGMVGYCENGKPFLDGPSGQFFFFPTGFLFDFQLLRDNGHALVGQCAGNPDGFALVSRQAGCGRHQGIDLTGFLF